LISVSAAQANWKQLLKQDVVKLENGKMSMVDYFLVKGTDETGTETSSQVKLYSEASNTGFISRDNFVLLSATIYLPFLMNMGEYEEITEPIGSVDFELNLYMTSQGVQIEFKDNTSNTTNRNTITWSSMF
jgi:hypothetical protein